jgi:hypothetical protein
MVNDLIFFISYAKDTRHMLRIFHEYGINWIMKYGINKNGLKDNGIMGLGNTGVIKNQDYGIIKYGITGLDNTGLIKKQG